MADIVKMDVDQVKDFYVAIDLLKLNNVELVRKLFDLQNNVVDDTYVAAGANQFQGHFLEIFNQLSGPLVNEMDDLIKQVVTEIEDFVQTGQDLGQ